MKSNETAGEQAPAKRKMLRVEPVRSNLLQGSTHDAVASLASSSSRFRVHNPIGNLREGFFSCPPSPERIAIEAVLYHHSGNIVRAAVANRGISASGTEEYGHNRRGAILPQPPAAAIALSSAASLT